MQKADSINIICPHDTAKIFDGDSLRVTATATGLASGEEITIGYSWSTQYGPSGFYNYWPTTEAPGIINTDSADVRVYAYGPNYNYADYCHYTLKINCRQVILTSHDSTMTFTGSTLQNTKVTVSGDGWVPGHEGSYSSFASIWSPGTAENTFSFSYPDSYGSVYYNSSN